MFRHFQSLNPEMGFAENLGVVVNMKDRNSPVDDEYHRWLTDNAVNRCFTQVLPRLNALQHAARYSTEDRSFAAKYPGEIGAAIRKLVGEMLERLGEANNAAMPPPTMPNTSETATQASPGYPAPTLPVATSTSPPELRQPSAHVRLG